MTIRISHAGSCPRRLILEARGVEGLPPWPGMERAFAEGNIHEASILEWACAHLPGGPYVLKHQQAELSLWLPGSRLLSGHPDGVAYAYEESDCPPEGLVEAKCLAQRAYQSFRDQGVRTAQPQYFTQVQLYMHAWNTSTGTPLEGGWLVARNKETPHNRYWDHHYEWIPYDPDLCAKEVARLTELQATIDNAEDIAPPYHPAEHWQCRPPWCPYTFLCHSDYRRPVEGFVRQDDLTGAVSRYMEIGDELTTLNTERDVLKEQLTATAAKSPVLAGNWQVRMAIQRRESFDTKLAREELAPDLLARLLRVTEFRVLKIEEVAG